MDHDALTGETVPLDRAAPRRILLVEDDTAVRVQVEDDTAVREMSALTLHSDRADATQRRQ